MDTKQDKGQKKPHNKGAFSVKKTDINRKG